MALFVKFRASGENTDFSVLKAAFINDDYFICKKGAAFIDKYSKEEKTYAEDVFLYQKEYNDFISEDDALKDFLQYLIAEKGLDKFDCAECKRMIWISVYPDGYHTNISFSHETIRLLNSVKTELDIEVKFLDSIVKDMT